MLLGRATSPSPVAAANGTGHDHHLPTPRAGASRGATLARVPTTPDAVADADPVRESRAGVLHGTALADELCGCSLSIAEGEEGLRVTVPAGRVIAPVHRWSDSDADAAG